MANFADFSGGCVGGGAITAVVAAVTAGVVVVSCVFVYESLPSPHT